RGRFRNAGGNGFQKQRPSRGIFPGGLGSGTGEGGGIRMREAAMKDRVQLILLPLGMILFLVLFVLAERLPGIFANTTYLGVILALQIAFVALSHFEEVFFPLLMGTFL